MVGVCSVCASCVGVSSLSGISKRAPSRHGPLSGYAQTGTYSAPTLTGTSSVLCGGLAVGH